MLTRLVKIALFALVIGSPVSRLADAAVTTNYSDLWWNPLESGWGVNISQQADILFVTFFVFDANRQPSWYTAELTFLGQRANGNLIFTGDNYVTSGPRFDGRFDPATVGTRKVGSASFTATSAIAGTLVYMVDGVTIRKSLVRQTLKTENVSGTYVGAASASQACSDPTLNGEFVQPMRVTLVHSGSSFQMSTTDVETGRQCFWAGTYIQDGQVARAGGDYSCASGEVGTFNFFEIQSSISGIMGRLSTVSTINGTTCNIDGRLAAVQTANVDLPSLKTVQAVE